MTHSRLFIFVAIFFLLPVFVFAEAPTHDTPAKTATSTPASSSSDTQALIKELQSLIISLQTQINELKDKLATTQQEVAIVKSEIQFTAFLAKGAQGDEVKQLQEILKQDPEIYPEGTITGFFGPATEAAVKRFQEKHKIEARGVIGPKTRAKLNEIITQTQGAGQSGVIPPGLARAQDVQQAQEGTRGATSTTPTITSPSLASTASSSIAALIATTTASTATTSPAFLCAKDAKYCATKEACVTANFSWYTVSCHKDPPPSYSCAASYNYCISPTECAAQGWYSCRSSCYGSLDACQGQAYVPPALQAAIPVVPAGQTGTTTVPAVSVTTATTTSSTSVSTSNLPLTVTITSITPYSPLPLNEHFISSVTLQWNAVTNPSRYLTYYKAWRKIGNGDWLYWANTQQTTFPDLNIGRGTYYYRVNACYTTTGSPLVLATDTCSPDSNIMTVTIAGGGATSDTTPPGAPTNLTASIVNADSPYISWTASTDNVGVAGYNIYRNGAYLLSVIGTTVIDGTVARSTTASYTVAAYDAAGNISAQSSMVSAITPATDTAPPVISGIQTTNITTTSAEVTWSTNEPADTRLYYDIIPISGRLTGNTLFVIVAPDLINSHSYVITGLAPSKTYYYAVKSKDAAGNQAASADYTFTTAAPSVTTNPSTSIVSGFSPTPTQVSLSWSWSTDSAGVKVTGYKVFRNNMLLISLQYNPSAITLAYNDQTVSGGMSYNYYVKAFDAAGNESFQSNTVSVTTPTTDTTPPSVPNLTATAISSTQINLSWSTSADNVGVTGYKLYRDGVFVFSLTPTTFSFSDTGVLAGTSHTYNVAAYDAAGNVSAQSSSVSATTFAYYIIPPSYINATLYPPPDVSKVYVTWPLTLGFGGYDTTTYRLYRRTVGETSWTLLVTDYKISHYTDTGRPMGTYEYKVQACDVNPVAAITCSPDSNSVSITVVGSSTATTTTSSLDLRARNLAVIAQALDAIKEKLSKLLQGL